MHQIRTYILFQSVVSHTVIKFLRAPVHDHVHSWQKKPLIRLFVNPYSRAAKQESAEPARGTGTGSSPNPSPVIEYLISEISFNDSDLEILKKRRPSLWNVRSADRARSVIRTLREDAGLTGSDLRKVIAKNPSVLVFRADEYLKPRLDLLKSLGFSQKNLAQSLLVARRLINAKDLHDRVQYFQSVYRGRKNLLKAAKINPSFLGVNPTSVENVLRVLQESGMDESAIFRLIGFTPVVLARSAKIVLEHMDYIRGLGISDSSGSFALALAKTMTLGMENIRSKIELFRRHGFDEKQIRGVLNKSPSLLTSSVQRLDANLEYLLQSGGVSRDEIVKKGRAMDLSLEKRIKPRHRVYKFLIENQLCTSRLTLMGLIDMGEVRFRKAYLLNKPREGEIFRIYQQEPS